jgi:hypothetical protein
MVEWYWQGSSKNLSTNSNLVAKQEKLVKEMILSHEVSLSYYEGFFNMPLNRTIFSRWLYFSSERRRAADFYRP